MALGVVVLDVFKVGSVFERIVIPIQVSEPFVDVGVAISDHSNVALEVLYIDWVKTNNGWVETDVNLSQGSTEDVWATRFLQQCFNLVKALEDTLDMFIISLLGLRKPCLVDPVVNLIISPGVEFINLRLEFFGVIRYSSILRINEVVKLGVKEADDF